MVVTIMVEGVGEEKLQDNNSTHFTGPLQGLNWMVLHTA